MNTLLKGVGFARFLKSESTPTDYSTEILAIERAQRCKFSLGYFTMTMTMTINSK
jgi:hypothetical protein